MALFEKKTIVKNEIDYDKLAESISKALIANQNEQLLAYKENACNVITNSVEKAINKAKEKEEIERNQALNMTSSLLLFYPYFIFIIFSCILYLSGIFILGYSFYEITSGVETNIKPFLSKILIALLLLYFSYLFGRSAQEINKLKDINTIIPICSALFSIIAAVFAVLTFIRG